MKKTILPIVFILIAAMFSSCIQAPDTVTKIITNTETKLVEIEKPLVITSTYVLEHPETQTVTVTTTIMTTDVRTDYLIKEVTVTSTYKTTVVKTSTEFVYSYTTKTATQTKTLTKTVTKTITQVPTTTTTTTTTSTTTTANPADHSSYTLETCQMAGCHEDLPDSHYYRKANSCGGCHTIGAADPAPKNMTPAMHEAITDGAECLECHTDAMPDNASHAASMVGMCLMCHGAGYWDD